MTQDFFLRWGLKHRLSSTYNSQSNGRAELAVKSTKRLLEENIGSDGELDTEKFLRAMLIKRNTPDPVTKLSPAEIIFGRKLRDSLPRIIKEKNIFFNKEFRSTWRDAWKQKEVALRTRYQGCQKRLGEHCKALPPLCVGDRVAIQNQFGKNPTKWERTGTIVEERDFDKYVTKVDGSGRLTLRNRRYLKKLFKDEGMFQNSPPLLQNGHTLPKTTIQGSQRANESVSPQLKHNVATPVTADNLPVNISMNPGDKPSLYEKRQIVDEQATSSKAESFIPTSAPVADSKSPLQKQPPKSMKPCFQPTLPLIPEAPSRDRPSRIRKQTKQYDASLGVYVDRTNGV